jgi:hypothetical protein
MGNYPSSGSSGTPPASFGGLSEDGKNVLRGAYLVSVLLGTERDATLRNFQKNIENRRTKLSEITPEASVDLQKRFEKTRLPLVISEVAIKQGADAHIRKSTEDLTREIEQKTKEIEGLLRKEEETRKDSDKIFDARTIELDKLEGEVNNLKDRRVQLSRWTRSKGPESHEGTITATTTTTTATTATTATTSTTTTKQDDNTVCSGNAAQLLVDILKKYVTYTGSVFKKDVDGESITAKELDEKIYTYKLEVGEAALTRGTSESLLNRSIGLEGYIIKDPDGALSKQQSVDLAFELYKTFASNPRKKLLSHYEHIGLYPGSDENEQLHGKLSGKKGYVTRAKHLGNKALPVLENGSVNTEKISIRRARWVVFLAAKMIYAAGHYSTGKPANDIDGYEWTKPADDKLLRLLLKLKFITENVEGCTQCDS